MKIKDYTSTKTELSDGSGGLLELRLVRISRLRLDPASNGIVEFLQAKIQVPMNCYFESDGTELEDLPAMLRGGIEFFREDPCNTKSGS